MKYLTHQQVTSDILSFDIHSKIKSYTVIFRENTEVNDLGVFSKVQADVDILLFSYTKRSGAL